MCWSSLVAQRVKDLVLSLLLHRFNPWLRNFSMLQPKKKSCLKTNQKEIWVMGSKARFAGSPSKNHNLLTQESIPFFWKGSQSNYLRICRPHYKHIGLGGPWRKRTRHGFLTWEAIFGLN